MTESLTLVWEEEYRPVLGLLMSLHAAVLPVERSVDVD